MDVDQDRFWPWLGFALEEALKHRLTDAAELLTFANPDVLVAQLPRELTTALVATALASGSLTPASVLQCAPPPVLAEHLESDVLWRCLSAAAERANLDVRDAVVSDEAKSWLEAILGRALADGMLTPAEVVQFVTPVEFVRDAPLSVVADLIRSGLTHGTFNPELVLEHLTPSLIANRLQPMLAWSCVVDAVKRRFGLSDSPSPEIVPEQLDEPVTEVPARPKAERPPKPPPKKGGPLDGVRLEPVVAAKHKSSWTESPVDGNDVDVLDDQPLPPPPIARQR